MKTICFLSAALAAGMVFAAAAGKPGQLSKGCHLPKVEQDAYIHRAEMIR